MDGVILTPLKIITNINGNVYHGMKKSDKNFYGFGEAYFSTIKKGSIKGWKMHKEMTLNLIVIYGEIKFVVFNNNEFFDVRLSKKNYQRLTIKPGLWLAFQGLANENTLLNLANIQHDPLESEKLDLKSFKFNWS